MSMSYCHKHDRHRDTDFHVYCPDCEDEVGEIEDDIADCEAALVKLADIKAELDKQVADVEARLVGLRAELLRAEKDLEQV